MLRRQTAPSVTELRKLLRSFCVKHHIRRLDVFGSVVRCEAAPGSDVDLLVTLDDSRHASTAELLEMAGEAEELVGVPVDFVLRRSLEKSPNAFAREDIFPRRCAFMEANQLGRLRDILASAQLIASYV